MRYQRARGAGDGLSILMVSLFFVALITTAACVERGEQPPPRLATLASPLTTSYAVQQTTGTYQNANGTVLWDGAVQTYQDVYTDVPIGFSFDLFDRTYTTVRVSTNGVLTFGDTDTNAWPSNTAIPSATAPQALIAPWWDALLVGNLNSSYSQPDHVEYEIAGTAPARIFEVEWYSITIAGSDPNNLGWLYFSVWLYEGTNVIELRYGGSGVGGGTPPKGSASVGIEDRTGMIGYRALACTPNCGFTQDATNNFPAGGTVYRFTPVVEPVVARSSHTATLLTDGTVLAAGGAGTPSAELYRVQPPAWNPVGDMTSVRSEHTATVLLDGNVFVAGGADATATLSTTEIYGRASRAFKAGPDLKEARQGHTATLLADGRVFIAGGVKDFSTYSNTAEIYDPKTGQSTLVNATMPDARAYHTATLLPDGHVFIAGGYNGATTLNTAVVFNVAGGTFTPVANKMTAARRSHTATLLTDGTILLAAGRGDSGALGSSEVYSVMLGTFTAKSNLNAVRYLHSATLLLDGTVLVTGGFSGTTALDTTEIYNPVSAINAWSYGPKLATARYLHTATMLPTPAVIVYGGTGSGGAPLKNVETIANVGAPSALLKPIIATAPATASPGDTITITGTGIRGPTEGSCGGTQDSPADVPNATITVGAPTGPTYLFAHDFTFTQTLAGIPCATPLGAGTLRVVTDGVASDGRAITIGGVGQGAACTCDEACQGQPPAGACWTNSGLCTGGRCAYTPQVQGTACNDGSACTWDDQCDGQGACAGTAYTCTPNQCQSTSNCDGNGGCTVTNKGPGTPCNDNDPCTDADHCDGNGNCVGTPRVCNSPPSPPTCINPTTSRVYNPQGSCSGGTCSYTYNTIDCRPGTCNNASGLCTNPCNGVTCNNPPNLLCYTSPGTCTNGACQYPQNGGACNPGDPCVINAQCDPGGNCRGVQAPVGTPCDDGNACARNDACDANGKCVGAPYTCPGPTECQLSVVCDGAGGCTVANKPDTAACTPDAYACTNDHCNGAGACVHTVNAANCLIANTCYAAGDRQPGQQCTGCDPAQNRTGWTNLDVSAACDDGNVCTSNDHCDGLGHCAGTGYTCPAPNQCQVSVACNGTGGCAVVNKAANESCNDGNACTSGDHCDGAGNCAGALYACTPGPCDVSSVCDGLGGCTATHKTQGTACDDNDACTKDDQCSANGVCAGTAYTCAAPTECQVSNDCDGAGGCTAVNKGAGVACSDDGLTCTLDQCNGNGQCNHPLTAGFCLIDGVCYASGDPDPANGCNVCDPSIDTAAWTARGVGEACDDHDPCTKDDKCDSNGVCAGAAYSCPRATECQEPDVCDGKGGCAPKNRPDGTACTTDNDPCTKDECKAGACVHTPMSRGSPCNDDDPCTENDKCDSNGKCAGTPIPNCQADGGTPDGAVDGGRDGGGDAGQADAAQPDGAHPDGGADGGKTDAGHPDAGKTDGGKPADAGHAGDGSVPADGAEHTGADAPPENTSDMGAVGGGCSCATVGM